MAGEIASDVVNNSLYGDLYQKGKGSSDVHIYRIGNLRLDSTPIGWGAFNLTKNYRENLPMANMNDMIKVSKDDLSEQEKKNLERLLKQPSE